MTRKIGIMIGAVGVVLVAIAWRGGYAAEPEEELTKQLRAVAEAQVKTLNAEDADGYEATMHSQSPVVASTIKGVKELFEKYDMKYELKSFTYIGSDDTYIYARTSFTTKLIGGPAIGNKMDQVWVFRKEKEAWKFWNSARLSMERLQE